MGFLSSLFGGPDNPLWTVLLALGFVLVLIVLGVWILKMVFNASGNVARARTRRIAVIDNAPVDQRRQLLLVRRDNVEHLILIGGAQDLVVETGIPVTPPQPVRPARRPVPQSGVHPEPPLRNARPRAAVARDDEMDFGADGNPASPSVLPQSPLDQLRELGRPANERKAPSLRHPGLLRPVSRLEPAAFPQDHEKLEPTGIDSDTSEPDVGFGHPSFGEDEGPQLGEHAQGDDTRRSRDKADTGF